LTEQIVITILGFTKDGDVMEDFDEIVKRKDGDWLWRNPSEIDKRWLSYFEPSYVPMTLYIPIRKVTILERITNWFKKLFEKD
jgi:hypothetical protein